MSNIKAPLEELLAMDGAKCAALISAQNGQIVGYSGDSTGLETAAKGNAEFLRAKLKTMKALNINDFIEDIVITYGHQYHMISPVTKNNEMFLYLVLDKEQCNLALARRNLHSIEDRLEV